MEVGCYGNCKENTQESREEEKSREEENTQTFWCRAARRERDQYQDSEISLCRRELYSCPAIAPHEPRRSHRVVRDEYWGDHHVYEWFAVHFRQHTDCVGSGRNRLRGRE